MGRKDDDRDRSEDSALKEAWEYNNFAKFYLLLQLLFIILFGSTVDYADSAKGVPLQDNHPRYDPNNGNDPQVSNFQYIKFQVLKY